MEINLNNKKFKPIDNSPNGEVGSETEFHYRQKEGIVWATYSGGNIKMGMLIGKIEGNKITSIYQQLNPNDEFLTGRCDTIVSIKNGKIRLNEKWQWTCKDFSKGTSLLEEI